MSKVHYGWKLLGHNVKRIACRVGYHDINLQTSESWEDVTCLRCKRLKPKGRGK